MVSWVSFLIPAENIAGRMAMLITLFLVLVNIFGTVTAYVYPQYQGTCLASTHWAGSVIPHTLYPTYSLCHA